MYHMQLKIECSILTHVWDVYPFGVCVSVR